MWPSSQKLPIEASAKPTVLSNVLRLAMCEATGGGFQGSNVIVAASSRSNDRQLVRECPY